MNGVRGFWATQRDRRSSTPRPRPATAINNAALPVMAAMGGRLDPTLAYKLVNAVQRAACWRPARRPGAALGTGADTGITGPHQQWQFLAQGADPTQNATTLSRRRWTTAATGSSRSSTRTGCNVLDGAAAAVVQSPPTADIFAITGTNAAQEWDVLPAGNCGDVPANCTAPPLVSNGDGDYYMIVNKATGKVLASTGTGIEQQAPAAPSNGDWIEPANQGQLWRIVPARITEVTASASSDRRRHGAGDAVADARRAGLVRHVHAGRGADLQASTTADVVSTAGDATLTWSGPDHLANGAFALPQPLQVSACRRPGARRSPTTSCRSGSASRSGPTIRCGPGPTPRRLRTPCRPRTHRASDPNRRASRAAPRDALHSERGELDRGRGAGIRWTTRPLGGLRMRNPVRSEADAFHIVVGSTALLAVAVLLGALARARWSASRWWPARSSARSSGSSARGSGAPPPAARRPSLRARRPARSPPRARRRQPHADQRRAARGARATRRGGRGAAPCRADPVLALALHRLGHRRRAGRRPRARSRHARLGAASRRRAHRRVGDPNVALGAIEDELRRAGADEVLISTLPAEAVELAGDGHRHPAARRARGPRHPPGGGAGASRAKRRLAPAASCPRRSPRAPAR